MVGLGTPTRAASSASVAECGMAATASSRPSGFKEANNSFMAQE